MMASHPWITPVHTGLQGRARFNIRGLRGCLPLKAQLENRLASRGEIMRVSASTLTGNLLVLYHPAGSPDRMSELIQGILQDFHDPPPSPRSGNRAQAKAAADGAPPDSDIGLDADVAEKWHNLAEHEVLSRLQSSREHGLATAMAEQRLDRYGPNTLPAPKGYSRGRIFSEQFHTLPLVLLAAEAVLALATGALIEAVVIAGVVGANALIGYAVDSRTQQTLMAAKRRPRPAAEVIRDGQTVQVPGEDLVPGDILVLNPGVYIGADSRIMAADNLKIDESLLTGESIPVDKQSPTLTAVRTTLFDRRNMAFMGTLVVGGNGLAVVVATGEQTQYGRMQHLMTETFPPRTRMTAKLHALSRQLVHLGAWICAAAFGLGWLRGLGPIEALRSALSMATAVIPAGLPSTATANLALGIHRLAKQGIAIRKLYALETLGAVRIVCFDKTGTLTRSRISVLRLHVGGRQVKIRNRKFLVAGQPVAPLESPSLQQLIQVSVLCNESKIERSPDARQRLILKGSPTEKALLFMGFLAKADIFGIYRDHALKQVVHRGEYRRRMITVHTAAAGHQMVSVKGDPLEVLRMCVQQLGDGGVGPLSEFDRAAIENENDDMAADGLRVLGLAYKTVQGQAPLETAADYIWIGLVAMAEPIRQGVEALMTDLHQAGIDTAMITGDQNLTAAAVAGRIGLAADKKLNSLDSSRFDTLEPELLKALIQDVRIFSRVNPSQKLQIVRAFQQSGHPVAMTGDGINDGPALKAADIGIAMGLTGTDVAREVADIILEDDNLANLGRAVAGGRTAHRNLKKSIRYFLTANFSDAALSLAALAAGAGPQPVRLNILPDILPGLALLADPARPDVLATPPVDLHDPLFSLPEIRAIGRASAVITAGAVGAFVLGAIRHGSGARSVTMAAETLAAGKILHALNCRSDSNGTGSGRSAARNGWMGLALTASLGLQWATLLMPGLRRLTGAARLDAGDLAITALAAGATFLVNAGGSGPPPG
jgi:P-type Ca2+ transporter type 2C